MDRFESTRRFLRMAASKLRRLAEWVPEIADELQAMARQLDSEADHLIANPKS